MSKRAMKMPMGNVSVKTKKDESIDSLIKRFNKKLKKEEIMSEFFDRMFYKKPSQKRKEKEEERLRVIRKAQAKEKALLDKDE